MCGCRGASGLLLRWPSVAGRWLLLVDFCDRRIRTPWAWRCECNSDGLTDAAGAASGLRVHEDSLRVRLTHSAARNQACGLWLCRHPPVDDHGIHGCAGPVLNIRESSVRGGCASTRVAWMSVLLCSCEPAQRTQRGFGIIKKGRSLYFIVAAWSAGRCENLEPKQD